MKQSHALVFALAQRYLKEFIPGEWRAKLEDDFTEAERVVAEDAPLQDWIDHKMAWFETWQGLLEVPIPNNGVLYGISTALFHGQQLKIKYRRGNDTKVYTVHPLGLVKRDGVFYLVGTAWDFANPLFFSLLRIESVDPQEALSNKPTDFDLHAFLERGWPAQFEFDQPKTLDVELLFRDDVYFSVGEKPLKGAEIHERQDGWFKVTGAVPNSMELRWWLLGFNDKIRILQPQTLADQLQNLLFDALTGLLQRRAILEHLDRLLAAGIRHQSPFALVMLDVDHFKRVNDAHGHPAGDAVLKEMALRLKETCRGRAMDILGRWGGEEFMILLPDTALQEALNVAERFRNAIRSKPITMNDKPPLNISISIGVRCVSLTESGSNPTPDQGESFRDQLLKQVDNALYKAKRDGRNRVCLWDGNTPDKSTE